jgi:hypothetical protein
VLGSRGIEPLILDLGTRRRRVVSFTPSVPIVQEEAGWTTDGVKQRKQLPLPGIEPVARPYADRDIAASHIFEFTSYLLRLLCRGYSKSARLSKQGLITTVLQVTK